MPFFSLGDNNTSRYFSLIAGAGEGIRIHHSLQFMSEERILIQQILTNYLHLK